MNTDAGSPPPPRGPHQRLVDVGGHRLFMKDAGVGSPTVVLEAGLGCTHDTWAKVYDAVAQVTHVLSYDRAGLGASDAPPTPRTCQDVAADLYALVRGTAVPGPYVLVGHSVGGWIARVFAHDHPETVAGLVFVDTAHPDLYEQLLDLLFSEEAREDTAAQEVRQGLMHEYRNPAVSPEGLDLVTSAAQVRRTRSLGDRPVVVLTAHQFPWLSAVPTTLHDRLIEVGQALQRDVASLSTHSTHIIAENSGHFIQSDDPDLVIDAIRRVVTATRQG